jgi:acetate kinase
MNIMVLNCGSSSIKCYLYQLTQLPDYPIPPIWEALLQWKNHFDEPQLKIKTAKGMSHSQKISEKTAGLALKQLISALFQGKTAMISSLEEIAVIGHRIVHGGRFFSESIFLDASAKEKIRQLSELAPLHNRAELEGIEIAEQLFEKVPQIAMFDTAFHHTLPKTAQIYPGPYDWFEAGIQRYGFHGISFQYCSKRSAQLLQRDLKSLRVVICHLGSGASLCAVKQGKSLDTTMGFTPLDGLMMDTRCGSVDPGILLYLLQKKHKTPEEISNQLYHASGLLGLSEFSSDMRDIIEQRTLGQPKAKLAFDVYIHRLNALIGSMIATLHGIDALVFTAGIGENAPLVREQVCEAFSFLGMKLDATKNTQKTSEDRLLSTSDSQVDILLIHTQEAFEIARECWIKMTQRNPPEM